MNEIKKLFDIVGHRKSTVYIIFFSILVAMIEFVGLALIVPYITIAINEKIPKNEYLDLVLDFFNITIFSEFIVFLSIVFVGFYLFRFVSNLLFQYLSLKYINRLRHSIMSKLFRHYAHIDYAHFVVRNSSDLKKTLLAESLNIQNILKAMIDIISEVLVLVLLMGLIFYVDWKLSLILFIFFLSVFILFSYYSKKRVLQLARTRTDIARGVHRELDETLNNFKFNKLIGAEKIKINKFEKFSMDMSRTNMLLQMMNQVPKYFLETLGFIVIVGIVLYSYTFESAEPLSQVLSVYAIAFYRASPSANKIIVSFNNFQYFKNTIDQVYNDLNIKKELFQDIEEVNFEKEIELKNLTFRYSSIDKDLFNNLNICIKKGEHIAITGQSGCGKSTLLDILMGILTIEDSAIIVDGIKIDDNNMLSWRRKFGYIPQEIYLFDGTVADNVVFGREYDENKLIEVLKQANIYDYLLSKQGIDTRVGENGVQLSGGQKQRIGIARALYGNPEILVLDEATSALDSTTEKKIMDEIYEVCADKTLIVIAHRLSTLEKCDKKIILETYETK